MVILGITYSQTLDMTPKLKYNVPQNIGLPILRTIVCKNKRSSVPLKLSRIGCG